jgi:Tfp pilus assembly protein PilX
MGKNSKTNQATGNGISRQQQRHRVAGVRIHSSERGAALATALIVMSLLAAISMTVLAVVTHESRIAGSDLQRTQTFYAAAASIEKMTSDFCALYARTSRPTNAEFATIAAAYPPELTGEGFSFGNQSLALDPNGATGTVTIPNGPFSGLVASVTPYILDTTATQVNTGTQVRLQRKINNYLVPIFQFGMFSNEDLEVHPGPAFAFNGRVHANGNLYVSGTMTFLSKVTTANELVVDVLRNGNTHAQAMTVKVGAISVPLTAGSAVSGPNFPGKSSGQRGYFPGSPSGSASTTWDSTSVSAASSGVPNKFGGQVLTRSTGGVPLLLPMQIEGNMTRELIKRILPSDSQILSEARYSSKAQVRILIDDEGLSASDAAGIPSGQGVNLSTFDPVPLPNTATSSSPTANGGGRALWRINDNNTSVSNSYNETSTSFNMQQQNGAAVQADTVRGIKKGPWVNDITGATNANPIKITCPAHGYSTGDKVFISGVGGNTNANGGYTITKIDADNFTLNGRSGNGNYTSSTGIAYSFTAIPKSSNGTAIATGSGITGHILIQIVDSNGVARDVTQQVLSLGMTEGEPNAIFQLQRPLWAAFTQGSRDASGLTNPALNGDPVYTNTLADILNKTRVGANGSIKVSGSVPVQDGTYGYLTQIIDDTPSGSQPSRTDIPGGTKIGLSCINNPQQVLCQLLTDWGSASWTNNNDWNAIVPINVYNVREGRISSTLNASTVYERGVTNVFEINMRNLARWLDGVYDNNLLAGTPAVSTNVASPDGYTLYVSDRRGDEIHTYVSSGVTLSATNGMVDNEDIYGPDANNGALCDPLKDQNGCEQGEDVQATGVLVKDTNELPDPAALPAPAPGYGADINKRALAVSGWTNLDSGGINHKMFRNAVRLFNGENLQVSGAAGKLSQTKGITVSSENMVYIWGNYNTTGINAAPPDGTSSLNDNTTSYYYLGNQVPTSIVCDAFFPLSKTFFDSETALYPDDLSKRPADNSPSVAQETSVRTAIIAGNNLSALAGSPDAGNTVSGESRLNGGMHNFPRFLESWSARWNFVGSLIPLYHSVQALGQYNADSTIYGAPIRNWAFDVTFTNPNRLPPGTPLFQHIEPTGFKQIL